MRPTRSRPATRRPTTTSATTGTPAPTPRPAAEAARVVCRWSRTATRPCRPRPARTRPSATRRRPSSTRTWRSPAMGGRPLVVGVTDLRRQPGTRRRVQRGVPLPGLGISSARVPDGAEIGLDLELEALSNGLVATGTPDRAVGGGVPALPARRALGVGGRGPGGVRAPAGRGRDLPTGRRHRRPRADGPRRRPAGPAPRAAVRRGLQGPAPDASRPWSRATTVPGDEPPEVVERPADPRWAALDELRFDSPGDDG